MKIELRLFYSCTFNRFEEGLGRGADLETSAAVEGRRRKNASPLIFNFQ